MIGSSLETGYKYDAKGQAELIREPKLELNNNNSGKAEDIYLFTGQRPQAAFGNSTGDREMLEWTTAGKGKRLGMLVLHDDKEREYAYGPADGPAGHQGRHLHPGALSTRPQARLDGDQHEERLEAHLRVRAVNACPLGQASGRAVHVESSRHHAAGRGARGRLRQRPAISGRASPPRPRRHWSAAGSSSTARRRRATVLSQELVQPPVVGWRTIPITRSEYTVGVDGCGQRATYVVVCPQGSAAASPPRARAPAGG